MNMNKNIPFSEDIEFLELLRGVLLKIYGKDFSIKQIQEAHEIAELTASLFKDSLEKIYSKRYGNAVEVPTPQPCQNCKLLQEKLDALWTVHYCYLDDLEKECNCDAALRLPDYFLPETHKDKPEIQKAFKTLFPKK